MALPIRSPLGFWGVEVKGGEPLKVECGQDFILHLSQAALGEVTKDRGNEYTHLYAKIGDEKLVLGTLSSYKFPQLSFDLVFDKDVELSHNLKNGSVHFAGYKVFAKSDEDDYEDFESEEEDLAPTQNTGEEPQAKHIKNAGTPKADVTEPDSAVQKKKVNFVEPTKDAKPNKENEDSSDDDDEMDDDDDNDEFADDLPVMAYGDDDEDDESDDDDDDDDESDEEDEQTPKRNNELGKKRSADSAMRTPPPDKKAKLVTPQKTDGKKLSGYVVTPHPSKQATKTPAATSSTTKSFVCKSCNRMFSSDNALQSHTKAKHG